MQDMKEYREEAVGLPLFLFSTLDADVFHA
jgi:hypothetical protein